MEKVVFADSWQPVFAEFGLTSFDDFFRYRGAETIGKNNKRDVSRLTFGDGPERKVFFMKRFHNPHFKDMLFTIRSFGQLCSQAVCEWENANLLLKNGIETYRPVSYGEQTKLGLEKRSFFLTEEIQGQCLTDFVAQNWLRLAQSQKEKIIVSLAKLIRRVHEAGISLPDLYVWHIFINETALSDGTCEYDFAIIDLHRMAHNVTDKNQQIRNLGRLDHSMLDKYFDEMMRRLLIESYAGEDWPGDIAKLTDKVKKYSNAISSRRDKKRY